MSNVIPMVSASPPPFDDHSFGYDDDDDFGTFTGAGDSHESSPGPPEPLPIDSDWQSKTDDENSINNNPEISDSKSSDRNENAFKTVQNPASHVNGTDDFANFEQYEANQTSDNSTKKPHLENLPIQSQNENSTGECGESVVVSKKPSGKNETTDNSICDNRSPTGEKEIVQSSITGSRDSTTDSGMFSTDISPVPKSEDTAELCDKSCDSDNDDTFPDLPKDKTESTESLPTSDPDDLKSDFESTGVESDTRTSSVLEVCTNMDIGKTEDSRKDDPAVKQSELSEDKREEPGTINDEQGTDTISQSQSEFVSDDNKTDAPVGKDGSDDDDGDWGDFDTADNQAVSKNEELDDLDLPEIGTQSESSNNTKSEVQSEDECIEAIEEALKDSDNTENVNDNNDEDIVQPKVQSEVECQEPADIPVKPPEEKTVESDQSCDSVRTNAAHDVQTPQNDESGKVDSEDIVQSDNAQVEDAGFPASDGEWNAFGDFSESGETDNWADFQAPQSEGQESQKVDTDEDDFGAFSTVGQEEQKAASSVQADDDWADFEESEPQSVPEKSESVPLATDSHSKLSNEKIEEILSSCFPSSESEVVSSLSPQLEGLVLTLSSHKSQSAQLTLNTSRVSRPMWGSLQDLDKTNALLYQWSSSAANRLIFKTLHVDTQNILFGHKKQSVPLFAANIGLLEPIRGSSEPKTLQPRPPTTLVDTDKTDTGATQELPPVEFDWDNSGLTNPLAAEGNAIPSAVIGRTPSPVLNNSMSKTLDLDFLSVQETESVNKNTVFQSEILDAPRSSVKSLPPLEDILKNMKTTTTTRRRQEEHLSEEASRVIDSLPLLSFMTSKVLMFPLRQANE